MSEQPAYILSNMSWPEVKRALETVRVALIAVGSTEQHGPNLALQAEVVRKTVTGHQLVVSIEINAALQPYVHPDELRLGPHVHRVPRSASKRPGGHGS